MTNLWLTVENLEALARGEAVRVMVPLADGHLALQLHPPEAPDSPDLLGPSTATEWPCTGIAAVWCPLHGDCTCADREDQNDAGCPLHDPESRHATYGREF